MYVSLTLRCDISRDEDLLLPGVVWWPLGRQCHHAAIQHVLRKSVEIHLVYLIRPLQVHHHHRESYDYPHPANITLHNGGSSEEIGSILVSPLELPHVLLLPHWRSTIIRNATNDSDLPYLVSDSMPDTDALVIHRKNMDSCSGGRCWPNSK